jgi:hypothetical protein
MNRNNDENRHPYDTRIGNNSVSTKDIMLESIFVQ